jgi:SAM-dependent methyltransferase
VDPADFYGALAPHFHLIHANWEQSVERQGEQLDGIIREFAPGARTVLDVACGIGTQSLGLAARGYDVAASDITATSVERARQEAADRSLHIEFSIADMRTAHAHHGREFDVVLAADNAIPHLLSDNEILDAFREFRLCTKPGGVCVVSVRDYAAMEHVGLQLQPHAAHRIDDKLYSVYQVREFDGEIYVINLYVVEDGEQCTARVARTKYYAVSTDRLLALFREAGFAEAVRVDDRFFQPVLVAR